jgi:hypothetical protein
LDAALATFSLSEDAEGHLLGRGVPESRVRDMGIVLWDSNILDGTAPDGGFREKHGSRGDRLDGRLCTPIRSPRGRLLGVEARTWRGEKRVSQYLLPEAAWNPVFVGLTESAMGRVWAGGSVWIVEGLFDLGALEHVVPGADVVLATLRARVSDRHASFLGRFCRKWVNLVYDNDETGRRQTHGWVDETTGRRRWGALEVLSRVGVRARDVPYRGGKDPGEIWEHVGTEGLRRSFASYL